MPKRKFPFEVSCPLQLKMCVNAFHVDKEKHLNNVYARTQELLNEGAKRWNKLRGAQKDDLQSKETFKCQSCLRSKNFESVTCVFCERKVCRDCNRRCFNCSGTFCTLCSVVNYDNRSERYFCLGCSPH